MPESILTDLKIAAIVACDRNMVIGDGLDLPWHIPEDLKYFKEKTAGHPIVMGRKTWESLPKALPKRLNVVITRQANYEAPGAVVVGSLEAALQVCVERLAEWGKTVFIVGGGEIYRLALPLTDTLYVTRVDTVVPGGVTFPHWDETEFSLQAEDAAATTPSLVWQTWQRQKPPRNS